MRVLPTLVTGLAALRTAQGEYCRPQSLEQRDGPQGFMERLGLSGAQAKAPAPAAPPSGAQALGTRYNKCLDVTGGRLKAGTQVQLWDCDRGNKNQQWKLVGQQLRTAGTMCLDSTGNVRVGTHPHLWPCDASNANQRWEMAGMNLRLVGSNQCLDVEDGQYWNGRLPQLYPCQWDGNEHATNQHWFWGGQKPGAPAAAPAAPKPQPQNGAATFLGLPAVSIEAFCAKHPECAPYKDAFVTAAQSKNLHPTFLAAIAIQESTCRPWVGGGLMQFTNDQTWAAFKTSPMADKNNAWDAAFAGANYLRALLDHHGNDLDKALREYNGEVRYGGKPAYPAEIKAWLRGDNAY